MANAILSDYAVVVTFYTAAAAIGFMVLYHIGSGGAWRRDPMGRHVMALTAVDGIVFGFLCLAMIWPSLAAHLWYQVAYLIVGVTGIPWVITWRVLIYLRMLRRRNDGSETP